MRIALFVTCLADAHVPAGRAGPPSGCWSGSGTRSTSRPTQTCCGQMHVNTGYQQAGAAAGAAASPTCSPPYDVVVAPSGSCVGSVRHQHAMVARRFGVAGLVERGRRGGRPKTYELSELLVDVLGVTDVGAYFPHRVTYHPTCHSLRMLRVGDKPLRLLRAVDGARAGRAARRRPVLRLRRHLRDQERRHLDRDAGRQDAARAEHRRRGLHRRGQLLPDAHRRRPVPAARGHPDRAPGPDPGLDPGRSAAAQPVDTPARR